MRRLRPRHRPQRRRGTARNKEVVGPHNGSASKRRQFDLTPGCGRRAGLYRGNTPGRALDRGRRGALRALALGARGAAAQARGHRPLTTPRPTRPIGLACQGTALLWRGDFQNARQMLTALASRADRPPRKAERNVGLRDACIARRSLPSSSPGPVAARAHAGHAAGAARRGLRHSAAACARHPPSLRGSLWPGGRALGRVAAGVAGSHRRARVAQQGNRDPGARRPHPSALRGVRADSPRICRSGRQGASAGGDRIVQPWPSTSAPGRACWPPCSRGGASGTSSPPTRIPARWRAPARTSSASGWAAQVEVVQADLFPEGRAALVVCNPPWVPARPSSPIERGIYDPESRMLRGFLAALPAHLEPGGEGWLILSDLAEHLGLRTRAELLGCVRRRGLDGRGSKRRAAGTSPGLRRNRSTPRGARRRGDIALAPRRALSSDRVGFLAPPRAAPLSPSASAASPRRRFRTCPAPRG